MGERVLVMSALPGESSPILPSACGRFEPAPVIATGNNATFGGNNVLDVLAMACGEAMELQTPEHVDIGPSSLCAGAEVTRAGGTEGKDRFYLERHRLIEKRRRDRTAFLMEDIRCALKLPKGATRAMVLETTLQWCSQAQQRSKPDSHEQEASTVDSPLLGVIVPPAMVSPLMASMSPAMSSLAMPVISGNCV